MRFFITLAITLVMLTSLSAQDLDSEIRSYRESDEVYISKARQFIADELRNNDLNKVRELTGHLAEKFKGTFFLPLQPWEQFVIGLAADSLELTVTAVDFINEETDWNKYVFPGKDALYLKLDEILSIEHDRFTEELHSSELNGDQLKVIEIFLDVYSKDLIEEITQETVNSKCDSFLAKYPDSAYSEFIRNEIRNVWVLGNWGFGFDFDGGYNTRDKDLGDLFNDGVGFNFSLYATYKKTVLRFNLGVVSMNSAHDFVQNGEWEKGDHFNYTVYGMELGYELFESRKFKLEPHLFGGGSQIDFSNGENDSKEILVPSWTYGPGIAIYYKLSKSIKMDYQSSQNGFWYISLNCDYLIPAFSQEYDDFDGNSLSITIGLGGYGRPMVRDL